MEAETKLKKALLKVEEESCSFQKESQLYREKVQGWEEAKRAEAERKRKK